MVEPVASVMLLMCRPVSSKVPRRCLTYSGPNWRWTTAVPSTILGSTVKSCRMSCVSKKRSKPPPSKLARVSSTCCSNSEWGVLKLSESGSFFLLCGQAAVRGSWAKMRRTVSGGAPLLRNAAAPACNAWRRASGRLLMAMICRDGRSSRSSRSK